MPASLDSVAYQGTYEAHVGQDESVYSTRKAHLHGPKHVRGHSGLDVLLHDLPSAVRDVDARTSAVALHEEVVVLGLRAQSR
jgi:hypothetical protein